MVRSTTLRLVLAAVCGSGLAALAAGPAAAAGAGDPPGNNGTVKVDDKPFDDHPNNEPHVGCEFQIDFYGFDEGDLSASVLFEAVPPTVPEDTVPPGGGAELLTDEVDIGEDAAGGGTDLDASETYDLTEALAGIEPHPEQGWHVRLTVNAEGSIGADTKHKVFWVSGCGPTTTTTTHGSSTSSSSSSTTSTTKQHGTTTSTMDEGTTTTGPGGSAPTSVTTPGPSTTVAAEGNGGLPVTGSSTLPLVLGAVALLTVGAGGVGVARYLRHTAGG
jgi:hypothetical protein